MGNTEKQQSVAEQIVDMLAGAGIKHLYAITGDSLNNLTDAITRDGRIDFVHVRHEESAAFAADAEAMLTGQLAACAGSSGPGHVHLINGLYDAQRNDAPVLAIASTCASNFFGCDYFQETNPTLLFSNCSVYNQTANNAAQVPHMLQAAMQEAVSRGGVGIFGLPADVTGLAAVSTDTSENVLVTDRVPEPSAQDIERIAALINNAGKVTIFAGMGARGAYSELLELAYKLNTPVATTFKSQMYLTRNNDNYVGHMGYLGMYSAENAVAGADVVLVIGTHFPFPGFFPDHAHVVQVDVRPQRIGRIAKVEIGVRADSGAFLRALLPKVEAKNDRTFLDGALKEWADIQAEMAKPVAQKGKVGNIRPEYFFSLLDKKAAPDAVFTVDTGMNCLWASHYLTAGQGRDMIGSFMHGSMANAMPQSIGAAKACPGRQIIALCGDGGFTMLMGDLLTMVQEKLPVKLFVADNRSLAYVQWEMALAGLTPSEVSLTNPDFGALARAAGLQGETVSDPADLPAAIDRWLAAEGPALLSVQTQTEAASFTFSEQMMSKATPGNSAENFLAPGSL